MATVLRSPDPTSANSQQPLVGITEDEQQEAPGGWQMVTNVHNFIKWQYKESAYRVIADLDEGRGHCRALFTSVYDGGSYIIAGNLGGPPTGMMKAVTEARKFMRENKWGCPPPSKYD